MRFMHGDYLERMINRFSKNYILYEEIFKYIYYIYI